MHNVIQLEPSQNEFKITMTGDGVGGYRWTIDSFDEQILQFNGKKDLPNQEMMIGGGLDVEFNFELLVRASTIIKFASIRSWNNERGSECIYEIKT